MLKYLHIALLATLASCAAAPTHAGGYDDRATAYAEDGGYTDWNDPLSFGLAYVTNTGEGEHYGIIRMRNGYTLSTILHHFFTFETTHGPVEVYLNVTTNIDCTPLCPDLMRIESMPLGVTADVPERVVPEGGEDHIKLFPYNGS